MARFNILFRAWILGYALNHLRGIVNIGPETFGEVTA
jgi:hypothetical protein